MKPTDKLLFVTIQNMLTPNRKFIAVPIIMPMSKEYFLLQYVSEAHPMIYAIIGKERINPPVGPTIDCQPPVKFENTGRPNAPNRTYISVAVNAGFAPSIIAVSVMIKV